MPKKPASNAQRHVGVLFFQQKLFLLRFAFRLRDRTRCRAVGRDGAGLGARHLIGTSTSEHQRKTVVIGNKIITKIGIMIGIIN